MFDIYVLPIGMIITLLLFVFTMVYLVQFNKKISSKLVQAGSSYTSHQRFSGTGVKNEKKFNNSRERLAKGKSISEKFDLHYLIDRMDDDELIIKSNLSGKIIKCNLNDWSNIKAKGNPEQFHIIHI